MMLEILAARQAAGVASAGEMDEAELPFELAERSPPQLLDTSVQEKGEREERDGGRPGTRSWCSCGSYSLEAFESKDVLPVAIHVVKYRTSISFLFASSASSLVLEFSCSFRQCMRTCWTLLWVRRLSKRPNFSMRNR